MSAPAPFGGLESVVQALAIGLRDRGHHIRVIAATGPFEDHRFVESLRAAGIDVLIPPRSLLGEARQIRRLALADRVDVVHAHGYRSDILAALTGGDRRFRTVSTVHGFTGGDLKARLYESAQLALLRRYDAVVAVSRPLETLLRERRIRAERLHLIPNAFHSDRPVLTPGLARERLGLPDAATVIGWVGRLSVEKAPEIMLQALGRLSSGDWIAAFIGDGPELPELSALAERLGLASRIRWIGAVPHAAEMFSAFDVLVQSSRTEGTPMVLLEAMTHGIPIVATSVGGVPDLLGNGEAGWLVPADDPGQLGAAIQVALNDRVERESRVSAARRRIATQYDPEAWLRRYEELYRRVVNPR